jgi:hypothetical protein
MKRVAPAHRVASISIAQDVLLVLSLAALGAWLGALVLSQSGRLYFYQFYMPESIYSACGHGFVRPAKIPQPVLDFLLVKTTTFDCALIGAPSVAEPLGVFTRVHLYLAFVVAALWRMFSIDYRSLWPLVALLSGTYACGCFVFLRLFFGRLPALAGGLVLTFSPIALSMTLLLRDYSKAPFFIWSMVLLVLTIRARTVSATALWAVLAGGIVGLGYGFRSDIIIVLPIGMMFLGTGIRRGAWSLRVSAVAAFTAATLIVASPMLMSGNTGGFGSVLMEGLSEPFRINLGLGEAPYSLGQRYSDELTLSSIAADMRAKDPTWDSREGVLGQSMSQAVSHSGPYVLNWLGLFSGDVATQTIKSAAWIIGLPAYIAPGRIGLDPTMSARGGPPATQYAIWLYDDLGTSWFPAVCMIGLAIFFWGAASTRPREALALLLMFGALLCYPVVQFSIRHVFHLEFIWIVAVLSLIVLPFRLATSQRVLLWQGMPRFIVWSLAVAILVGGTRAVLVAYQERSLRDAFNALLAQPRERITMSQPVVPASGAAVFSVPVPDKYRELIDGPADSMTANSILTGVQWKVRAAADRLLLTVGGPGCDTENLVLSFRYAKREHVWQPFDHEIPVHLSPGGIPSATVLVSAFYRPSQYLSSIQVPKKDAPCIEKIERLAGPTSLPSILTAVFAPGWQDGSLHRGFGDFPIDSKTSR